MTQMPQKNWLLYCCPQEDEVKTLRKAADDATVKYGPCESSIEVVLQKRQIQRQAYHGGAFVGNHVHKALKPKIREALTSAPVNIIRNRCPTLLHEVESIPDHYDALMEQYLPWSQQFSSSSSLDEHATSVLEDRVAVFMVSSRREVVSCRLGLSCTS